MCFKAVLDALSPENTSWKKLFPDPADNTDDKIVCTSPPTAPSTAKMNITYLDSPMCPGKIATYNCIAGGINAFKVFKLSHYSFVTTAYAMA